MNSKAVSPMIATILLVAFTVAVGGIISIWLTGFTRTQTATAGAGAACLASNVRIFSPLSSSPTNTVNAYIMNLRSDMNITITSGLAICGGVPGSVNTTPVTVLPGQTGLMVLSASGCTLSNTEIRMVGNCSTGGSFVASCPVGTCSL